MKKVVTKKIVRGQQPVEYRLTLSFELEQAMELGGQRVSGEMTVPIRKGAGARLAKYKKEDIAMAMRQLADVIEKGDYASMGPNFGVAVASAMDAAKKGKAVAN